MATGEEPDKHCSRKSAMSRKSRTVPVISFSPETELEPRKATVSRKLSNLLPSRTLYHKKKSYAMTLSPETAKYHSLPKDYSSTSRALISNEINRQLSNACHRKKPIIKQRSAASDLRTPIDVTDSDGAEVFLEDEAKLYDEEHILEQLAILRSLPIPLKEKREYRKNLFLENAVPAKGKSVWKAKKDKAKGKIKESLKEFFGKLQVWSSSLKFIEGHFGTSVVSYFIFLRWLLFLNLYIFLIFLVFIVLPQVYFPALQHRKNITTAPTTEVVDLNLLNQLLGGRKLLAEYEPRVSPTSYLDVLQKHSSLDSDRLKNLGSLFDTYVGPKFLDVALNYGRTNYTAEVRHNFSEYCYKKYVDMVNQNTSYAVPSVMQDFFQGTGWMELTLMFTGYYLPTDLLVSGTGLYYNLSVAFLSVLFALYIICLIMMINYTSKGVRENLLSTEVGVQSYCNMVFCGWDYCIENGRTANLKHRSILLELKGNMAEVRRQQDIAQWTTLHKAKVYLIRSIVNIFVIASLVGTYYLIYYVAQIQLKEQSVPKYEGFSELLIQFLPPITITAVNFILPVIFDILVRYESYGVQAALNTTLVRIIFVRLASIIILVITFHRQIACEPKDMCFIGKEGCSSPIVSVQLLENNCINSEVLGTVLHIVPGLFLCWETHVGQQMYRLVLMDFFVVIGVTLLWEVPRNFIVQRCKCKLTEMIGRQTFDVPSQVLAIVYSQTLCWLGVFYSPLLPVVCVLKMIILFYVKKFTLVVNCVPSQISYRASRSNAVFVIVLMLNFFITVAILGYSITSIAPSPGCSPFRHLNYMVDAIREALNTWSPHITQVLRYIFSTGFAIATIIFLCLAIYYYLTVTTAHKRMIKVLKSQLVLEGRDKQFLLKRLTEVACEGMSKEY